MKILKKIAFVLVSIITITLMCNFKKNLYVSSCLNINYRKITNIAVLIYSFNDTFMMQVKQSLEDIEKENKDKVKFTFYDGRNNNIVQDEQLDSILRGSPDLILGNLVNPNEFNVEDVINKVKVKNVPLVLLDMPPEVVSKVFNYYNKVAFIAPESNVAGMLQGKILVDLWNANKSALDKNNDNTLQYILLEGKADSPTAIERSKYSISTINDSGIKTEQLARINADWSRELAKSAMDSLFLKYAGNIEAIISNNDSMAIGAIETLQKYGYNIGDQTKNIAVVGVDALPEAKELINKGFMTGTVFQDPMVLAEVFYKVGMNLVENLNPLSGTNYKAVDHQIIIPYLYQEYIKNQ